MEGLFVIACLLVTPFVWGLVGGGLGRLALAPVLWEETFPVVARVVAGATALAVAMIGWTTLLYGIDGFLGGLFTMFLLAGMSIAGLAGTFLSASAPRPALPDPTVDHSGVTLTLESQDGWRVVAPMALWLLAPPVGALALLFSALAGSAPVEVRIEAAELRWRRKGRTNRLPLQGLTWRRERRVDGTPMLRLRASDGRQGDLLLGGTPPEAIVDLVAKIEEASRVAPNVPALPTPPPELESIRSP